MLTDGGKGRAVATVHMQSRVTCILHLVAWSSIVWSYTHNLEPGNKLVAAVAYAMQSAYL